MFAVKPERFLVGETGATSGCAFINDFRLNKSPEIECRQVQQPISKALYPNGQNALLKQRATPAPYSGVPIPKSLFSPPVNGVAPITAIHHARPAKASLRRRMIDRSTVLNSEFARRRVKESIQARKM